MYYSHTASWNIAQAFQSNHSQTLLGLKINGIQLFDCVHQSYYEPSTQISFSISPTLKLFTILTMFAKSRLQTPKDEISKTAQLIYSVKANSPEPHYIIGTGWSSLWCSTDKAGLPAAGYTRWWATTRHSDTLNITIPHYVLFTTETITLSQCWYRLNLTWNSVITFILCNFSLYHLRSE